MKEPITYAGKSLLLKQLNPYSEVPSLSWHNQVISLSMLVIYQEAKPRQAPERSLEFEEEKHTHTPRYEALEYKG